jgi:ferritin
LTQLISDNLASVLQEQQGAEIYNSNLYIFIAGWLKNKGFSNLAKHFEEQHEEEISHSLIIYNLLTDLNAPVIIPEIDKVDISFSNVLDIATAYLNREILTTNSLNEIKKLAIDEDNPVVEERIREMIKLQQNEYAESTDWSDKANMTGGDPKFVFMWDLGVGT